MSKLIIIVPSEPTALDILVGSKQTRPTEAMNAFLMQVDPDFLLH